MSGRVEAIHVAAASGDPLRSLECCEVSTESGLSGDRHGARDDTGQVTVVSADELAEVATAGGYTIEPGATRRNVTVSGVDLRHEPGFRLRLGPVLLEFSQTSAPCSLMEKLIGAGAKRALDGKAGMEMRVLAGGELCTGDAVVEESDA